MPERLLLAHAKGQVLFITGAGTSMDSGLPDFRGLVRAAYRDLDAAVYGALPAKRIAARGLPPSGLNEKQLAEVARFVAGDFDVALGMLERRMDGAMPVVSTVRQKITDLLRRVQRNSGKARAPRPTLIHRALIRLADRGGVTTIGTTNFDLLLEAASTTKGQRPVPTHALGGIPRPSRMSSFAGVLHIHGVLSRDRSQPSDIVVTDQDFGEFYLRRRVVPDFIYDTARLFHIVLVGYSANDAPMRYLLNAVAADGSRFDDLKERFAFVALPQLPDLVAIEDWKGRGITPIPYDASLGHSQLPKTLKRWSRFSPINGNGKEIDSTIRRIVSKPRSAASESDRDLFDHLIRRSNPNERLRLTSLTSKARAQSDWLEAILKIGRETDRDRS